VVEHLEPARPVLQLLGGQARPPARPGRSRQQRAADLTAVLALLAEGTIAAQIAARFPPADAADAMTFAKTQSVRGKVILEP
jgi:NADPH:quinone reductase-like Zn-dependent oxidoreductase